VELDVVIERREVGEVPAREVSPNVSWARGVTRSRAALSRREFLDQHVRECELVARMTRSSGEP